MMRLVDFVLDAMIVSAAAIAFVVLAGVLIGIGSVIFMLAQFAFGGGCE